MSAKGRIGKYELLLVLGEGGAGKVHAARDTLINRDVAIKSLHQDIGGDNTFAERFIDEARNLGKLNHPNITTLFDLIVEGDNFYMVMELVRGRTLEQIITARHGRLPVEVSLRYLAQIGEGLSYAHRRGVIHRDIKPANIMIADGDTVKIMDFGIARARGAQRHTKVGKIIGSLAYMSPEQIRGADGTERSDIYSLGIVLYEMLTGAPPFRGKSDYELMQAQVDASPASLRRQGVAISAEVEAAILRSLAKKPEDRFASVLEFVRAVDPVGVGTASASDATRLVEAIDLTLTKPSSFGKSGFAAGGRRVLAALSRPSMQLSLAGAVVVGVTGWAFLIHDTDTPGARTSPKAVTETTPVQLQASPAGRSQSPQPTTSMYHVVARPSTATTPSGAANPPETNATAVPVDAVMVAFREKRYSQSFEMAKASDQDSAEIQYILARSYDEGLGTPANLSEAERRYKVAARKKHVKAAYALGYAYEHGRFGGRPDREKAKEWYEQAAYKSDTRSIWAIANYYESKQDAGHAVFWYNRLKDAVANDEDERQAKKRGDEKLRLLEPYAR